MLTPSLIDGLRQDGDVWQVAQIPEAELDELRVAVDGGWAPRAVRFVHRAGDEQRERAGEGTRASDESLYAVDALPSLRPWALRIAGALGVRPSRAEVSVVTSPSGQGFAPHFDRNLNVIVQLEGRKIWQLARGPTDPPANFQEDAAVLLPHAVAPDLLQIPSVWETRVLSAGSVLVVAPGTWHHTRAQGASTSLSVTLVPLSKLDVVLDRLRRALIAHSTCRERFEGSFDALGPLVRSEVEALFASPEGPEIRPASSAIAVDDALVVITGAGRTELCSIPCDTDLARTLAGDLFERDIEALRRHAPDPIWQQLIRCGVVHGVSGRAARGHGRELESGGV